MADRKKRTVKEPVWRLALPSALLVEASIYLRLSAPLRNFSRPALNSVAFSS